jgi:DNA-binding LytR/AlgR family response regulator
MRCLIIDDEPLAIKVIESYIEQIEGVEVVATCSNPLEVISILNKQAVDLVFLDIEMPNLTGIDLVKAIENMPQFIFTTAYSQYALDGFNLNATDYLVKPIPFHRFLKAISKVREKYQSETSFDVNTSSAGVSESYQNDFIFVKSEYENIKINTEDILYIQGLKDYIKIYTKDSQKAILTLMSFKNILEKLPKKDFLRVHKSYIINIQQIKALQKTKVIVGNVQIPIGDTFKAKFLERLGM